MSRFPRRWSLWAGISIGTVLASGALAGPGGARLVGDGEGPPPSGNTIVVDDDKRQCPQAQFTDLRLAAVAALPGDTILVCPGIYPGPVPVTKQLTFIAIAGGGENGNGEHWNGDGNSKARNGSSRSEARYRSTTDSEREAIVLGGPLGDGFTLFAGSARTVIDGFVITGGLQPVFSAGINVRDPFGNGYQILDNLITKNNVGMYFESPGGIPSRIERNAFIDNTAGNATGIPSPNSGTAIFTQYGLPINDTTVADNYSSGQTDSVYNLGDGSAHGLLVERNASWNDSTFLVLGRATGSVVRDNRIARTRAGSALYFFGQNKGVQVVGNSISGTGPANSEASGIRLTGPFFGAVGPNEGMTIARNDVRRFDYGIRGSNVTTSSFDRNRVRDNGKDGIQMGFLASAPTALNTLTNNRALNNGVWDCEDQSLAITNTWIHNHGETANPPYICTSD